VATRNRSMRDARREHKEPANAPLDLYGFLIFVPRIRHRNTARVRIVLGLVSICHFEGGARARFGHFHAGGRRRVLRGHGGVCRVLQPHLIGGRSMFDIVLGGAVALIIAGYLIYALVRPEDF
jgi:K+-transporting ATPase KdpF subunit